MPRLNWKDHLRAAIIDLKNSDRDLFEQKVYDALRVFADRHLRHNDDDDNLPHEPENDYGWGR